jgi:hypothetical protein
MALMRSVPAPSLGIAHAQERREEGANGETDESSIDGTTRWLTEQRANDAIEVIWFHGQTPYWPSC